MKEDYCSLEISKLLKDKGFNEICAGYYDRKGRFDMTLSKVNNIRWEGHYIAGNISAPTLQMAMAWLREKDVYIEIRHSFAEYGDKPQYFGSIYSKNEEFDKKAACFLRMKNKYEDAVEDVLKYCLTNLI